MAGEGEGVLNLSRGSFKVVFSYGGKEYEVSPLELNPLVTLTPTSREFVYANWNEVESTPLYEHIDFSQFMEQLNERAADVESMRGFLPSAAAWGHASMVRLLLAVDPSAAAVADEERRLPVHWAARHGETATCQLLMDAAPDTVRIASVGGRLPVHFAALGGHTATCQLLLDAAPDTVRTASVEGMLPVHWAALGGHTATCQLLLDAAPDTVRTASFAGMLPVHWAAEKGHTATCQLLLDRAPHTAWAAARAGLPLHLAAKHGHPATCQLLLDKAPDTAAATCGGSLPLHLAARKGHAATCQVLLDRAPQTAVMLDFDFWTPLHNAAYHGRTATCRLLLDGAPQAAEVNGGGTPLQLALLANRHVSMRLDTASCFIAAGPAAAALAALSAVPQALPLFADFLITCSTHLTSEEWKAAWSAVPAPCPGLLRALPAVLAHSAEQARHLVQHLPPADVQRLRTAALCLARAQKQSGVFLPAALVWRMLALLGARTCSAFFLV